ncbi:UV-stimulated scaffold protein A isoform X2 [Festucalex cinctus]
MELSQRDRLSELVEEITTSGQLQINREKIKEVKKICKDSNDCINHVFHSLMSQLNQDHAEIRLSAFQIASELFPKSHHFRTLLVDNFQVDFQDAEARTAAQRERETERQRKMERIYNERLKAAIRDLEDSSPNIEVALTELDSCLELLLPQFPLLDSLTTNSCLLTQPTIGCLPDDESPCCSKTLMNDRTEKIQESKERMRKEETDIDNGEEREEKKTKKKHKRCENEELNRSDKQKKGEMEGGQSYKQKAEDKEAEEQDPLHGDCFIRNSGLISRSYCLDLNLSPGFHVEETEDNEAVVSTLLDLKRLLTTKYLPAVRHWVQVFTKSGADQHLLKRALDLKRSLEGSLLKLSELNIDKSGVHEMASSVEGDDDDSNDFIEVPEKEGYESLIAGHLQVENGSSPSSSTPSSSQHASKSIFAGMSSILPEAPSSYHRRLKRLKEEKDPTFSAATFHILQKNLSLTVSSSSSPEPSSTQSNKDQTTSKAPVVPFGLDLYYWGQEQPNSGKITKLASQHQFWVPADVEEEVENKELKAESRCRYISFPGQFTPVRHYCNAPLGNGKMCKRQDRLKCPFHGRIVPRNQEGLPCNEEDRQREAQDRRKTRKNDWHDAELVRDIEIETGQNLGSDRMDKRGKRKKNKYPNLSNLKDSANTSRARLEKRIFNKSAMRRVAQMMSKVDSKKHEKFSNQFNYALN